MGMLLFLAGIAGIEGKMHAHIHMHSPRRSGRSHEITWPARGTFEGRQDGVPAPRAGARTADMSSTQRRLLLSFGSVDLGEVVPREVAAFPENTFVSPCMCV